MHFSKGRLTDIQASLRGPLVKDPDGYRSLPFPFEEVPPPKFRLVQKWDMKRVAAYMGTWSASQRFCRETGRDALQEIRGELTAAWGEPSKEREVGWDLHLRVGRVNGR